MINVAVIDGSMADRLSVQGILESDSEISVVGTAGDGKSAVELVYRARPDVVVLGLNVAVGDAHQAVRQIMAHKPTPILLLADHGRDHGEWLAQMLAAGALDAMEKPRVGEKVDPAALRREFLLRVKLLARVPVITHMAGKLKPMDIPALAKAEVGECRAVVAVVASTGGPVALATLLSGLPADLQATVLVVQHMAEGFIDGVARWLQEHCSLEVKVARPGDRVRPGLVLIGPDGKHMKVAHEGAIRLDGYLPGGTLRPSGDQLLHSVAEMYGPRSVGVVLTGMGSDGALGAASIRKAGGHVIVQDEATSTIFGMPRAAIEAGAADEMLPLGAIAGRLVGWIGR